MKDVSFSSGSNSAEVSFQNLTVWFSYRTPIAFMTPKTGTVCRENDWGPTTGKHLNAVDGYAKKNTELNKQAKAARLPGAEFERQLSEVLKAHGLSD